MASLRTGIVLMLALMAAGAALAADRQDPGDTQRLRAVLASLADPGATLPPRLAANGILSGLGLAPLPPAPRHPVPPTPGFTSTDGAAVALVDLRLMLTQIAIQTGAQDHQTLRRAQGGVVEKAILLRGGFVTLPELLALSAGTPAADHIRAGADGVTLTLPLVIWSDAGLHLGAADRLVMDRPAGSFLANLGWLDVAGGRLSGSAGGNLHAPVFRPFVLTVGTGRLTLRQATLHGLGFGGTVAFGGVAVVQGGLQRPAFMPIVADSALIDVATLSVLGARDVVISGNHLSGSRGTAIQLSRSQGGVITGNTLAGLSGPQAIRITAASQDIRVIDNVLTGGARTGILVDQGSAGILIARNLILAHAAAGISVSASRCLTIRANLIADTGGAGISIRGSDGLTLADNALLFNRGAGVLIRDQAPDAVAHLAGNVLRGNREGLRGASPGQVVLDRNDLHGQLPRLFAGDLAPRMVDWLRDAQTGAAPPAPCAPPGEG